eukprot:g6412.t1
MSSKRKSKGAKYDTELYHGDDNLTEYDKSIAVDAREQEREHRERIRRAKEDLPELDEEEFEAPRFTMPTKIIDRETDYQKRKYGRQLSPERQDAYAMGDRTPDANVRTYADAIKESQADMERQSTTFRNSATNKRHEKSESSTQKGSRWDRSSTSSAASNERKNEWNDVESTPIGHTKWEATPAPDFMDATPSLDDLSRKNRWDESPSVKRKSHDDPTNRSSEGASTSVKKSRSRWDETPNRIQSNQGFGAGTTPLAAGPSTLAGSDMTPMMTPGMLGASFTPMGMGEMDTPSAGAFPKIPMTPEQYQQARWEREIEERNRPLTDEELNSILPGEAEGYKILEAPASYQPIRTPARKLMGTPTPYGGGQMYNIPEETSIPVPDNPDMPEGLPDMKPEDVQHFGKLLQEVDEEELSVEEAKERKIMKLLLKVKNGTPPQRKSALRQLTEKARELGAGPMFNQILPLLMQPTLEDQERHLLVKVIDRVMFRLDELVRPYVHKILVVIEPLLIDEDYYARVEGREIIANLSKAAGLPSMIAAMRPDIDNIDEYVRNTTARAFSVVASALGIPKLLPFLKAVCLSKKSWQARHTGIKIVQQIAILMGVAILPHLKAMVDIIKHGLEDENQKVKTITALSLAALAEAAAPYGIESFDDAIGFIIPLMDAQYANDYTRDVMNILIREFQTPDEEMKKIVLKVVKQCVLAEGVEPQYIKKDILPEFFRCFWVRRMALDRRNYRQLVDTTVALAEKVGCSEIVGKIVEDLKDESEPYRRMVVETIDKVIAKLGAADLDAKLEELLIDGILYAFQEQVSDDAHVMLDGFGTVINSLQTRAHPYLPQICGTIKWRLNNKSAKIRQQAADLIARIAITMKECKEDQLLGHLGVVLYEYLGEEYPEVLGSILGALTGIVNVMGMDKMTPPIKDLLPRLTPILKNRHEKVQENCIDLVGRIADRGPEHVPPREWMRICFELLEMLKAHKKGIRRATVNTFGYIAKAIGPQDVLVTLLNNLKVQERQNRVCTTVAIAIVAETCSPFTVLPALMNEYKVPELNVQNGVLKALSFMFEYIGEMGKDYIYAVCPLLEDALMDRDLVHRQTAASVVQHIALGVCGLGCEDALMHLLNYVWPNIFETSPHVINAVSGAVDGMRLSVGPAVVLNYLLQGLFHPARKVREIYWKLYNNLYIGAQDALVAFYPSFDDEAGNSYHRHEMDLFV